jgi:tellurite resistance protein
MREFAPDTMAQLVGQLNKIATGSAALDAAHRGAGDETEARDALVEVAFLIAAVDGEVSALELAQFGEAFESAFAAVEGDGTDPAPILKRFSDDLEKQGWDKRMKAVARALAGTPHAEEAYRIAVGVAFVDDHVAHAEAAALDALASALGIDDDRSQTIMSEVQKELFAD